MKFRPCIDIHNGRVKQIVGGTLRDDASPTTNFETDKPASDFARLYKADNLTGGHVAMLGSGNEAVAKEALQAYPRGLQIGGGINAKNALDWIKDGAHSVIVSSYVFVDGLLDRERLQNITEIVDHDHLVLDLSCAWVDGYYVVMMDRWQRATNVRVDANTLQSLSTHCSEFLIHAIDKEGMAQGIDGDLVEILACESPCPTTYAGGISTYADIDVIYERGKGRVDYTVGSALDIFGGTGLSYDELVARTAR